MSGRYEITPEDVEEFERSKDGVLIHDGRIIYANRTLLRMFGIESLKDVVGKDVVDFVAPEYRTLVAKRIELLKSGVMVEPMVERINTLSGDSIATEIVPIPAVYNGRDVVLVFVKSLSTRDVETALRMIDGVVSELSRVILECEEPFGCLEDFMENTLRSFLPNVAFAFVSKEGETCRLRFKTSNFKVDIVGKIDEIVDKCGETIETVENTAVYVLPLGGENCFAVFSKKPGIFSPWEINMAKLITGVFSTMLRLSETMDALRREKERYRELAMRDPLTGAHTRIFFEEWLEKYQDYVTREGKFASLVVFDVDNLKFINDVYGHAMGDEALKTFSEAVISSIRTMDVFVRMGGDEFLLVLPETSKKETEKVVERISKRLGNMLEKLDFPVSFSYGISEFGGDTSFAKAFEQADLDMYMRKSEKRKTRG